MAIKNSTDLLTHLAHTQTASDVDYVLRRRIARVMLPADALAADTNAGYAVLRPEKACVIKSCRLIPAAAIATNESDYATCALAKEDTVGAGTTATTAIATNIATNAAGGGAWVAGVPETFAGIDDTDTLSAGQTLFVITTKAGAGKVIPDTLVEVEYELS